MEFSKKLDPAGRASRGKIIAAICLLFAPAVDAFPVDTALQEKIAAVRMLYDAKNWENVLAVTENAPATPADFGLYRGLALAHMERWDEAQKVLEATLANNPGDARIMAELAGLAYRKKDFSRAKRYLLHSLKDNATDEYSVNLLGSIYFLEGNLEAALKYWNQIGKPQLSDLSFEPKPELKPILLDRAFDFSRGSEWSREQFVTTSVRLNRLGVFQVQKFDLEAQGDGTFDVVFRGTERTEWSRSPWIAAATALSGLPYQEVHAHVPNIRHAGWQWNSRFRWDDEKRRVTSEIQGPLKDNPAWHSRFFVDLRNENWNLSSTLLPEAPGSAGVNLEKATAGMEIQSITSGRWNWSVDALYSYRRMRNPVALPATATPFFTDGSNVGLCGNLERALLQYPERRFGLDARASAEIGTFFSDALGRYTKLNGDLDSHWYPRPRGDDYETRIRLRGGRTFGDVPFDELYVLGFDRDTDLWMRGHPGLVDGKKGGAPLGREFVLANAEISKVVYSAPFVSFRLSPFLDSGKVYDPSAYFGTPKWMWDTGVQLKIRVLGSFEFVLGYGRDLRSGKNSFFSTVR
jgi:tetratricopeptide (TPR) repeat protein